MSKKDEIEQNAKEARRTVKEKAAGAATSAREGLASGASAVADAGRKVAGHASHAAEVTREVAAGAREKVERVADFVREAKPDAELKAAVSERTEHGLDRAGDALTGAAPAIGRGTERAVATVGQALHGVARPVAAILGAIAGRLGGWWRKAAEGRLELPDVEEQACRTHFASITVLPADMTYERARTGYVLGYVASRNPEYGGRAFDQVEPDLRQGFGPERAGEYDGLRDFARFGYERGTAAR